MANETVTLTMAQAEWLQGNDTGSSSKTIFCVMTGFPMDRWGPSYPSDVDDFGRCYRLLARFPEWRMRIHEMAGLSLIWSAMAIRWNDMSRMYEDEECTELYILMRELRGCPMDEKELQMRRAKAQAAKGRTR